MIVIRATLLAAAITLAAVLPAAAQQAASEPAAKAPDAAAPAAEAPKADAAPAEAAPGANGPDLDAMMQRLRSDLESLTESARQGAHSFLTRENPYVITTDELAVIAGGAVAGAILVDLLGGGGLASLAGAAAGGIAGHWLYTHPEHLQLPQMPAIGGPRGG